MLESTAANAGAAIIWSDVDIVFIGDPAPIIDESLVREDIDIWFQNEHLGESREINAGLVLMRCNGAVERLYRDALATMRGTPGYQDQITLNELLHGGAGVSWDFLPVQFAARSHCWPPARNLIAYHADFTAGADGVGQKIQQFRDLERIHRYGYLYA